MQVLKLYREQLETDSKHNKTPFFFLSFASEDFANNLPAASTTSIYSQGEEKK